MITQSGRFKTEKASQYVQQLCKHFAHKVAATYDTQSGRAQLPPGECTMRAEADQLVVTISADAQPGLQVARFIIDDHLKRFAHRENFTQMDWDPT